MKKVLLGCVLAALAVGIWWRQSEISSDEKEAPPRLVSVERHDFERVIEAVGLVEPKFLLDVKSKASGEITTLPFEEGDLVQEGALLAELLPTDEERNVRKQRASVELAQAQLQKAENAIVRSQLNLQLAKERAQNGTSQSKVERLAATKEAARQERLFQQNLTSLRQLEEARRKKAVAEAQFASAGIETHALKISELDIEALKQDRRVHQANLEKELIALEVAELRLRETKILAPMEGLLLEKKVERGQIIASGLSNVSGGTSLMTLADVTQLFLEASVDESDIGEITVGLPVELTAEAFQKKLFHGTVTRIAPQGVDVQGITVFNVRIELGKTATRMLLPGMNATVRIILERRKGALAVSKDAIQREKKQVFLEQQTGSGKTRKVPVKLGLREGSLLEFQGDLKPGDEIVIPSAEKASGNRGRSATRNMRRMSRFGGGGRK